MTGFLLGSRICVVMLAGSLGMRAATLTTLHNSIASTGAGPYAGVVQGSDGNFYGTAYFGGPAGLGSVYQLTPAGGYSALYSFCEDCLPVAGGAPHAGLIESPDGLFYGAATADGCCGGGAIFSVTASGVASAVYGFCSQLSCADGASPEGSLVFGPGGNLYGTTSKGGSSGTGTVFEVTPGGTLTTLHSFCTQTGCPDGSSPFAGVLFTSDGILYGTTQKGGARGEGTIFRITPAGAFATLHSFCSAGGCADGANPKAAVIEGADGNLYGTTVDGGAHNGGSIFKTTREGVFTTLYSFCAQSECADGRSPTGSLVQGTDGQFYGTTLYGGNYSAGSIFSINAAGELTTLYSFCSKSGCADGENPDAALIQAANGDFYGTTFNGGTFGLGTVFRLSVGLGGE